MFDYSNVNLKVTDWNFQIFLSCLLSIMIASRGQNKWTQLLTLVKKSRNVHLFYSGDTAVRIHDYEFSSFCGNVTMFFL